MRKLSDYGRRLPVRILSVTFILVLATISAQAYTVVLRSRRLVEIPDTFSVTKSAVVYEVGSGIQISIQLVSIDIPATERLNKEAAGSFLGRMLKASVPDVTPKPVAPAGRSITNKDLEPFAHSRRQSEIAYERRRKELGLPSVEESRLRAAAESIALRERFELDQYDQKSSEQYWRERATNLKADLAAADAEINVIQQQLDWLPAPNSLPSIVTFGSVDPFFQPFGRPRLYSATRGAQISVQTGVGPFWAPGRGNVYGRRMGNRGRYYNPYYNPYSIFPSTTVFGSQPYDSSYDRTVLMQRLNERIAQRAGLQARWRALEDDARRAGAQPGWLR